ncbi:hypothetical protein PR002_g17022 [Phytophthora rubi]|uniref:Uncharacterized protein n=2 Tax=Phytophthora rubi TaxID=129364 RepID=A0A6A3KBN2_9STRA|nr:hypothetical protein PR002_g17022 [Phytophthora rubi]
MNTVLGIVLDRDGQSTECSGRSGRSELSGMLVSASILVSARKTLTEHNALPSHGAVTSSRGVIPTVVAAANATTELSTTSLDPKVADTIAKRAILPVSIATCQRRRVSDSPASSDQATVEGRFEDGQSQQGSFPRSTAEEEDHPPAVAKPGRKPGHIWRPFKKIDPKKTHGRVQCLGCRQYLGSGKPQRNMVPHVLQCDNIYLLDKHFIRRVYNVPEEATTVSPSQPVAPGAAPTVPAQAERVDMLTYIYINGGILHGDNIDFARFQSHPETEVVGAESNAS